MTRAHRRWHLTLWLLVGLVTTALFLLSLALRAEAAP